MPTPFDLAVTDALLTTTRAVRRRLDLSRPVEPERIVDCIRIAQQAPTASNTQAWRWVVLTDPGRRKAIGELYASGRAAMQNARSAVAARDTQTQRVYDSAEYLLDHIAEVPVHVVDPDLTVLVDDPRHEAAGARELRIEHRLLVPPYP